MNNDFKIIIIGDVHVGKTCLIYRFVNNQFLSNYTATIGTDFYQKDLLIDGQKLSLKIWDTAGQEKFKGITKSYFHGVNGAIFVFDISSKISFSNIPDWIQLFNQESSDNAKFLLIGNKSDLDNKREVQYDEARELASQYDLTYFETSAKDNSNIQEAFTFLCQQINAPSHSQEAVKNCVNIEEETKKKKCCK